MSFRFLSQSAATKSNLAFVNDAGNAIMRVDNTTNLSFGENRDTIRVTSKDRFKVGSVWIADFLHVPYGVRILYSVHSRSALIPFCI